MATKKPKNSNKSAKSNKSNKKTAVTTAESVSEAVKTKPTEKPEQTEKTEKSEKTEKTVATKAETTTVATTDEDETTVSKKSCFSGFFKRKYEGHESILTVFKSHKFYGALLGEIIGTLILTIALFAISLMGIHNMAPYAFALVAIFIAIYGFSGACLNPIITVGMMASRRMSVIRGVMYIIAEIIGAWLGWLIFSSFHQAGGESAYAITKMTEVGENQFWIFAMVELFGAIMIAFFFARALKYKRSVFTFAATVAGGTALTVIMGYVISAAFFSLNSNFIFNPAAALMFQIFPTSGDDFGAIMGGVMQALSIYVLLPMVGGIIGFYISDFTSKLSGEN